MNIGIIGLGLIGGSIGRAAKKKTLHKVYGLDIDPEVMLKARLCAAIDDELNDDVIGNIDLLILSLYPDTAIKVMQESIPKLKKGAMVIDCCGTKRKIVNAMEELKVDYPDIEFIGVHPMAGREFSGISHAIPTLFENGYVIMTPVHTGIAALAAVKGFFMELGACGVEIASKEKHDTMIAYTSQLAHVLSSSYIKSELSNSYTGFSAGSFRDMTRVAKLNPQMWTELCLENADNLVERIDELIQHLSEYRDALRIGNEDEVYKLFLEGTEMKAKADELMKERKKNDKNQD